MQENIQAINSNVYVTKAITASATTATTTGIGTTTILKPQNIQNSACIDSGGKVVYRFPTTSATREKKEPLNGKQKCLVGSGNDCMRIKVILPSFWPAFLANIGICALLIGYIFIGAFLFMAIENDQINNVKQHGPQYTWSIISQNPASKLQQFQEQQQHPDIVNNVHYAHINNHTMNEVVLLRAATVTTKTTNAAKSNIQQITHTQRMPNIRDNIEGDNDREFQHTLHVNDAVEHNDEEAEERQRTVENIWEITVSLNILYKENWTRLAALELARFQNHLIKRLALDLVNNHHIRNPSASSKAVKEYYKQHSTHNARQVEWRFSTGFLYSLTLISTVGYGTLTPHTALGRAVTIAYGTLGIPLMLLYLSSVGSILAKLMRFWCTGIFCCCSCSGADSQKGNSIKQKPEIKKNEIQLKQMPPISQSYLSFCYVRPPVEINPEPSTATTSIGTSAPFALSSSYDTISTATHDSRHSNALAWSLIIPVLLCLLLWLFYIIIGSLVISLLEQWPLIDGIYFCFMSLTTIGFCDLLPGLGKSSSTNDISVWFSALYIHIGLTLISMCVNILHEEIIWRMRIVVKHHGKDSKKQATSYGSGLP